MFSLPKIRKKNLLPFLSLLVMLLSVSAGVVLIQQQQEIRVGAWDCTRYVFEVSQNGVVLAKNGSTRDEPEQQANVYINFNPEATLYVPALKAGDAANLGVVEVPSSSAFNWRVEGTKDCEDSGSHGDPTPTPTDTPTPTATPSPTCPLAGLGDVNCDGVIDIIDFQILSNNFATSYQPADLDGNGIVDIIDFQILSNNFGRSG